MDNLTKAQRSERMSRITGDNLKPESLLATALAASGLAPFARNCKDLPGKPDVVFRKPGHEGGLAVFVHGCFWHGCPEHFRAPKTRTDHWLAHVAKNQARDRRVRVKLRRMGYATMVVWEHSTKNPKRAEATAGRVARRLARLTRNQA